MPSAHPTVPVRIICVGHHYRCDDGVGPWIGDRLRERGLDPLVLSGEGAALIEAFAGADKVVVVDATQSGAPAGTIRILDAHAEPLPAGLFRYSSHRFGVAEAIETARALNRLPASLTVYGIEGAEFGFGDRLSAAVESAAEQVVNNLTPARHA